MNQHHDPMNPQRDPVNAQQDPSDYQAPFVNLTPPKPHSPNQSVSPSCEGINYSCSQMPQQPSQAQLVNQVHPAKQPFTQSGNPSPGPQTYQTGTQVHGQPPYQQQPPQQPYQGGWSEQIVPGLSGDVLPEEVYPTPRPEPYRGASAQVQLAYPDQQAYPPANPPAVPSAQVPLPPQQPQGQYGYPPPQLQQPVYQQRTSDYNPYQQQNTGQAPYQQQGQQPPDQQPVKNSYSTFLVLGILSLVFCGGLLAIPSIVYATKMNTAYKSGQWAEYEKAKSMSRTWLIVAVCLGAVFTFLYVTAMM